MDRRETLSLAMALTVLLAAAKAVLLPLPAATVGESLRWMLRLAIVAAPDVCFVAALAVASLVSWRICRRFPRISRCLRLSWFGVFYVAGIYGAVSVVFYQWTLVPLTLPALLMAGGGMASSIGACLTAGGAAALVLAPLALMLSPWLIPPAWLARQRRLRLCAALVLIAAYGLTCRAYVNANWTDPNRWERRIAQSPHVVFLASCLAEVAEPGMSRLLDDADLSDFTPSTPHERVGEKRENPNRPRNVLLIVLESIGAEYLGLYGSRHDTTPHLERLARRGVVFDNVYVQSPNSCKSLVSLTASVYPRLDNWLLVRDGPELGAPMIQEVLGKRGFRTCFAHSGHWSYKNRDAFLRRRGWPELIDAGDFPNRRVNSWGVDDRTMFEACLRWIDREQDQPFFLFAYTIETHHPYVVRAPLKDFRVDDPEFNRYLNAVRAADENIAWLMSELQKRGLDRSTLVAITADHGECFGQHNQRIHSFAVYEPAVHVPLLLLHPSLARHPRRITAVRRHIDVAPTLLDQLGVSPPAAWQGRDLFTGPDRRAYFCATGNELILGLREGDLKYHYHIDSGFEELFQVVADPRETRNLAAQRPATCQRLRRRLGGLVHQHRELLSGRR